MSANQTIKVFVRTKPTGSTENTSTVDKSLLNVDEVNSVISFSRDRKGHAEFQFSKVFGQSVSQQTVYNACSGVVVQDVIEGVNCCIMAYGQTGSGKTYTMYGKGWEDNNNSTTDAANMRTVRPATPSLDDSVVGIADTDTDSVKDLSLTRPDSASGDKATKDDPVDISPRLTGETKVSKLSTAPSSATLASATEDESMLGVIPRSIADLFRLMDEKTATSKNFDFTVYCQVMQIYNEKIYDLLQDRRRENPLQLRETGNGDSNAVCVRGMSVFRVYSKEEANQLLRKGLRNRAIRATDFNSESSRSHTILQLFVTTEEDDLQGTRIMKRSTFSLVDLAGSEKWRSSLSQSTDGLPLGASNSANGSNTSSNADQQLKEMNNINTSLHVLGNCVSALIEVPARKHIPYRDSVLTRLLQDALGGNGRTILIATVHNDAVYREETYSTLQFASRASRIKVVLNNNTSVSNERSNLEAAQKQIKLLRAKVLELQQNNNNSNNNSSNISIGVNAEVNLASSLPRQKTTTSSMSVACSTCEANAKSILSLKKQLQELREQNDYLVDTLDSHYIPYDLGSIVHSHKTPSAIGTPTAPQRKELNVGGNSGQCTPVKEPRDSQQFASIADVNSGVRRSHASSPMHLIPPSHNVPDLMTSKNSTNQLNNVDINGINGDNGNASLDNESPFQFQLDVDLVAATGGREGASSLMSRSVTSLDSFGDDNNDDECSVVSLSASKAGSVAASVGNSQQRQRGKSSSTAVRKVKSKKSTEQKSGGGSSNKGATATTSAAVTGSATKKRVVTADGLVVDSDSAEGITNNVDLLLHRLSFDSAALDIVASSVASRINNINNSAANNTGTNSTNMHYSVSAPNAVVQHTSGGGASASSTPLRSLKNAKAKKQSEEKQVSVHELHLQQQAQLHKLKELSGKTATAATVELALPQDRSVEAALAAVELALGNNSTEYTSHAQSSKTNKSPVKLKSPVKDTVTATPSVALSSGNSSHTSSRPQPYHTSSSHVPTDYSSLSGVLSSSRDFGSMRGNSIALPTTTSTTTASNSALKPIISAVPPTSSNPAICVKHGLDSCVLCQMFAPKADPVVSSFGPASSNPSASSAQGADVQQTGRPVDSYAYRPPSIYNHVTGAFEERVVTPVTAYNMQFPQPHHSAQVQQQSVQHIAQQPQSTYSSARAPPASSSQQPQQYQPQHYQSSPQFQSQPQQHYQPSPQYQTQLARPQLTSQPNNHPGFDSLVTETDPSGDVCRTHGVTGCLLCAMRASRDSQTNNSTAASTFSPNTYHHFSPYAFKAAVATTNAPADLGPLVTGASQSHSRAMSKPPTQPPSAESYDSSNMGYGFVDNSKKSRGISYSANDHDGQGGRSGGNNADAAVTERHLSRTNSGNAFIRPAPSNHINGAATGAGTGGFQPTNTKVSPRIHEIRSIPQLREQYQMPGTQHSPQIGSNAGQGAGNDIMSSGMYGNHHSNHNNLNNAVQSSAAAAGANMNSSQATLHSHHSHGSSHGQASHRYASSAAAGDDDENSDEDNRSLHSQHSHHSHHSARKPRHIRELEHSSQVQLSSNPHYPVASASSALQHPKVASSPLPSLSNIPLVQHPSRQQTQQQASQYSHHQPVHSLPGGKSAVGSNIHYEEEEEQEEDSGEEQEERMNTAELIGHNNREMDSLLKEPTVSTKVKKMKKKVKKRKKTPATGPVTVGVGGNTHVPMTTKRRLEQKINHIGR